MGKPAADKAKDRKALERGEESYRTFRAHFERLIARDDPEGGVTHMQLLEEITRRLTTELSTSSLKLVGSMMDSLDEGEIVDPRGPSSS